MLKRLAHWWVKRQLKKRVRRMRREVSMLTDGMKSSEFWIVMPLVVLSLLGPTFGVEISMEAVLGAAGYAVSRGIAKRKFDPGNQ